MSEETGLTPPQPPRSGLVQREAQPALLVIGLKRQVRLFIEVPSQVNPSLLRPDPDQQLARQLAAVRPFKAAQLLLNFLPGLFTLGTG